MPLSSWGQACAVGNRHSATAIGCEQAVADGLGGPLIVGSGIDVIEISRIERALKRSGQRFAERVFATGEIAICERSARSGAQFAIRFAAKEAVMKALGTGWARGVRWVDIETVVDGSDSKALSLEFRGRVAELAAELGVVGQHLAVSRTRSHAIAMVLLEGDRG